MPITADDYRFAGFRPAADLGSFRGFVEFAKDDPMEMFITLYAEPFFVILIEYFIVWRIMRPKDERKRALFSIGHQFIGVFFVLITSSAIRIIGAVYSEGHALLPLTANIQIYVLLIPTGLAAAYIWSLTLLKSEVADGSRNGLPTSLGDREHLDEGRRAISGYSPVSLLAAKDDQSNSAVNGRLSRSISDGDQLSTPDENSDSIYALIAEELSSGNTDKGLWTKIYAEEDGNETRVKVAYIRRRAEILLNVGNATVSEPKKKRT